MRVQCTRNDLHCVGKHRLRKLLGLPLRRECFGLSDKCPLFGNRSELSRRFNRNEPMIGNLASGQDGRPNCLLLDYLFRSICDLVLEVASFMIAAELAQRRFVQLKKNLAQFFGFRVTGARERQHPPAGTKWQPCAATGHLNRVYRTIL
jgi:hypothetical protein